MKGLLVESKKYLERYITVSDLILTKICRHAKRYQISEEICAWYADWEDFCSDWCKNLGYTRTEARKILRGGNGEFMKLPEEKGIVRFALTQ